MTNAYRYWFENVFGGPLNLTHEDIDHYQHQFSNLIISPNNLILTPHKQEYCEYIGMMSLALQNYRKVKVHIHGSISALITQVNHCMSRSTNVFGMAELTDHVHSEACECSVTVIGPDFWMSIESMLTLANSQGGLYVILAKDNYCRVH